MISQNDTKQDIIKALEYGADSFISLPIKVNQLLEAIYLLFSNWENQSLLNAVEDISQAGNSYIMIEGGRSVVRKKEPTMPGGESP